MPLKTFSPAASISERKIAQRLRLAKKSGQESEFWAEINEGMDKGHISPEDFSIRDLFHEMVEDGRAICDELFDPRKQSSITLAEANVDTADFSNISGQIIYSRILDSYNAAVQIGGELSKNVTTRFDGEKIAGISNLGDASEVVAESAAYPEVGVSEEWIETPSTDKRGLIVPVTKEAIFFDRTSVLLNRCSAVGESLGISKEKRIIDAAIGVTNGFNRKGVGIKNTYQTAAEETADADVYWANEIAGNPLGTHANVNVLKVLLDYMVDPNTGEPSPNGGRLILVPTELEEHAELLKAATLINLLDPGRRTETGNPMSKVKIVSSPLVKLRNGGVATDWWMGDFQKAIHYMENWPITVTQSGVNSEVSFTNDVVARYKASERGVVAIVNPQEIAQSHG